MAGQFENFRDILKARLKAYRGLRTTLERAIDNKHGTIWGLDQMESINNRFAELRRLDELQAHINIDSEACARNEILVLLANDLKNSMCAVKKLLIVLQIRLEGAKQNVSMKMKKTVKDKRIKGYKIRGSLTSESKMCIC